MAHTKSLDGTSIAYRAEGHGPAVVLVSGAVDDGSENAPLATALAEMFTVYNYARRGRGESGDTAPYSLQRETEDLAAVLTEAGGSAHVFGASSGGALALEAAAAGLPVDRLAVYDVPYDLREDAPQRHAEYVQALQALLTEGRRGDAFALAMHTWGAPADSIEGARQSPIWPDLEALAHTLPYDAACMGNNQPPTARLAQVPSPTLVLTGEASQDSTMGNLPPDFFGLAARAIAASVPAAAVETVQAQGHIAEPEALVPILRPFFSG